MCQKKNFIQNNNLSGRWEKLNRTQAVFTVGETEFNFGENFFSCVELWKNKVSSGPRLHYLAGMQSPMPEDYLEKLIDINNLSTDSAAYLIYHFPQSVEGLHVLSFLDDRIRLSLLIGNSQKLFRGLGNHIDPNIPRNKKPTVDAWFIKESQTSNSQMWPTLARLSSTGTSFTVVTEALNSTQKHLAEAGFNAEIKVKTGPKFSTISGNYAATGETKLIVNRVLNWQIDKARENKTESNEVTVLGAGIAGCTTAYALAKRGYRVNLIDRHALPACEASGHHHSVLYPKLSFENDPIPRINLRAILYASKYYQSFWNDKIGKKCGIILLPRSDVEEKQYRAISEHTKDYEKFVRFVTSKDLEALSGIRLTSNSGLFFPNLGWLPSVEVCRKLITQSGIQIVRSDIEKIIYNEKQESWTLLDRKGSNIKESPIVVLACSYGCRQFEQTKYLPLKKVRGQISYLPVTGKSKKLKTIVCGHGYLSPADKTVHCCGATYDKDITDESIRIKDHERNLDTISRTDSELGKIFLATSAKSLSGWAQFRCTTPDYLPVVGQVPDVKRMADDFRILRSNARASVNAKGSYLKNLYINCGLGSRGLSYAPLTAEILASEIANEFPPLETDLRLAMHPARFIIRDLKKRRL